jgi:hypothetical protein
MKEQPRDRGGKFAGGVRKGFTLTKQGYWRHTSGPHRFQLEHRVIMEGVLGRRLNKDEDVDHIDRNRQNNNPSNLRVLSHVEHGYVSSRQRWYVETVVAPREKQEWDEYFNTQQETQC